MPGLKYILLFSLSFFLACSKKDSTKNDNDPNLTLLTPADLPQVQKNYQFLGERCDTGSHSFYETNAAKLQLEYCSALIDEDRNRHCARSLRHLQFKTDCTEVMDALGLMIDENGDLKPVPQYEGIKTVFAAELLLVNLWVDKIDTPFDDATIIKTEYIIETKELLEALTQCGQQFSGPACTAYREHTRLDSGLLDLNGEQVYYYLAKFNQHRQRFLVTYPVQRQGTTAFFNQSDIYIVDDEVREFIATPDFRKSAALIFAGSTFFSKLSKPRAMQLMDASESSEQLVHLASWLLENTIFENEKVGLQQKIAELYAKKSASFGNIPPASVFQYLHVLKSIMNAEEFEQALVSIVDATDRPESKTLISAAAAELMKTNPDLDLYLKELLPALTGEYPPGIVLALQVLQQKQYALSASTINQIIKLFSHYDSQVAQEAYKTLLTYSPGPALIPTLKKYFDGKNEQAKKYAFLTIAGIDDPIATETLLEAIEKISDPLIKDEMMKILNERRFTDVDVEGLAIKMKSSTSYSLQRQAIDWLFKVGTEAANIELIDFMKQDTTGLRYYVADRLPDMNADGNSLDYLRNVLVFEKPLDIEDYLVRGVIKIAANPEQKNLTDKMRENGLRDVFELLRSEDEQERALVLDELRKVPLPGKHVEKVISEQINAGAVFYGPKPNPFPDVIQALPGIIGQITDHYGTILLAKNLKRQDNNLGNLCIEALRDRFERISLIEPAATFELAKNIDLSDPALSLLLIDFLGRSNHSEGNAALVTKTELADEIYRSRIMAYLDAPNVIFLPAQANALRDILLKPGNPDYRIKSRIMDLLLAIVPKDESTSAILDVLSMPEHFDLVQKAFAVIQTRTLTDGLAQKIGNQIRTSYDDKKIKAWLVDALVQMKSDIATQNLIRNLGLAYPDLVDKMLADLKQRTIPKTDATAYSIGELLTKTVSKDVLAFCFEQLLAINSHLADTKLVFGLKSDDPEISSQIISTLKEKQIFASIDPLALQRQKAAAVEFANQIMRTDLEPSLRLELIDMLGDAQIPQAHEALVTTMSHPDAETRAYIIETLKPLDLSVTYGENSGYTMPEALAKQVETSPYSETRAFCLEALAKIKHTNIESALIGLYYDKTENDFYKDEAYREAIFSVIKKQSQWITYLYLNKIKTKGFESPYKDVRRRTLDIIIQISNSGSPDANGALGAIMQNMHHSDPEIRKLIFEYLDINILSKKTGPLMIDALALELGSEERQVRLQATKYLGILYQKCVRCEKSTIASLKNLIIKQKTIETDREILAMLEALIPTQASTQPRAAVTP